MDEKMTFSKYVDVMVAKTYALRGLGWTDMHDLPPYEYRCALLNLDTLAKRRSIACEMFIFDVLSGILTNLVVRSRCKHFVRLFELTSKMFGILPICAEMVRSHLILLIAKNITFKILKYQAIFNRFS
jgi:hypothetical protein